MKQVLTFLFLLLAATSFSQSFNTIKVRKPPRTINYILCHFSGNTLRFYYPLISCELTCSWKGSFTGKKCTMEELTREINTLRDGTVFTLENIKQKMDDGTICTISSMKAVKSSNFQIVLQPLTVD